MSNNDKQRIKNVTMDDGYTFQVYVPDNVDEDTKIFIYEHGDGGYASEDWYNLFSGVNDGSVDSIIVRADRNSHSSSSAAYIADKYGIEYNNIIPVGFSGGGVYSFYSAGDVASNVEDGSKPNVAVLLEGSCPVAWLESQGYLDQYQKANTVFLYVQNDSGYGQTANARKMAEMGYNVLILSDYVANGHCDLNASFITSGLLDYAAGNGTLPDRYVIQAYDKEKGWYTVDLSTISNIEDVYKLFGIEVGNVVELKNYTLAELTQLEDLTLSSDQKDLERYLNSIRGAIRSSSILTASISSGFSSTTMMPSQIPAIVSRYIASSTNYLTKLANETDQFALIGESIKEMDFNLERMAREVNAIELAQATYADLSSGNTDDKTNDDEKSDKKDDVLGSVGSLDDKNGITDDKSSASNDKDTTSNDKTWTNGGNSDNSGNTGNTSNNAGNSGNTSNKGDTDKSGNNGSTSNHGNSGNSGYSGSGVGNNNGSGNTGGSSSSTGGNSSEVESPTYEFEDYADIVTNDEQLVFEVNEEYKIIVHHGTDNQISSVEHYYDFGSKENALELFDDIKAQYEGTYYFEDIVQDGQYIKVILDKDVYKDFTLEDLISRYEKVNGYVKV